MVKGKHHHKPSRQLGHIAFSKTGRAFKVAEPLPSRKEDLEATIVAKFVGRLRSSEGRDLCIPTKGDQWPDFETSEGEVRIGIEIVEVLNIGHARKRRVQELYASRVRELLGDEYGRLTGLTITLDDGYQDPPYPLLNSKAGQALVQSIVDNLRSELPRLERLEIGRMFVARWQTEPSKPQTGAGGYRVAPPDSGSLPEIGYSGIFPALSTDVQFLLSQAIAHKISKNYPVYSKGKLILLAYEVFSLSVDQAPSRAAALARNFLSKQKHPFDEVWYFYPYAAEASGHIERIWP